jgi:diguanylate cyclase (GGDEF)-like protein
MADLLQRDAPATSTGTDLLAQAEELARIGSMQVHWPGGEVDLSPGMLRLFDEQAPDTPPGVDWLYDRVPEEERAFVRMLCAGASDSEPFEFAHRILRRDGSRRTVLHRAQLELDASGQPRRMCTILQDITAQRESEQALQDLANLDPVTRLPNRRAFLNLLEEALNTASQEDAEGILMLLEIDQLSLTNESLGYAAGDQLLREIAHRLGAAGAGLETLAHLGAGTYAALMLRRDDRAEVSAQRAADQLIQALAESVLVAGSEVFPTCSIGVAVFPADGRDAAQLLDRAQAAKHQAQAWGSNQSFFYTHEASDRATARLAFEADLRHALQRQEFDLVYRPQPDLRTGRVVAVESHLCWRRPGQGEVPLAQYLPVAEQIGLSVPIGEWGLRRACADAARWQAEGLGSLRVIVPLAPHYLELPDLAERIGSILKEGRLAADRLTVQVTEAMLLAEPARVEPSLAALEQLGVRLSLAGFGTGSSNLGTLSRLAIDEVRIDRSLVPDLAAASEDVSITRALIDLAHRLQMKVVANGVDTDGQLALLLASQCDRVQGRCFSEALNADGLAELLRSDRRLPQQLLTRHSRPRTLLLVDDEENILNALRRLLRRDGYHILTAGGGAEGLKKLAENTVDVIVSDQRMPHMTGVEFLRRAKELYPESIRLCLSGYTELQSITDAVNEGAVYRFLTKPWDDEQLRGHVAEAFMQKERGDRTRNLEQQLRVANRDLGLANERLTTLSERLSRQVDRHDAHLMRAQELLGGVPLPLIGVDVDGVVAYTNEAAERLRPQQPWLGHAADEVLPEPLRPFWRAAGPGAGPVWLDGRRFDVSCSEIGAAGAARGRLICLSPSAEMTAELPCTEHP